MKRLLLLLVTVATALAALTAPAEAKSKHKHHDDDHDHDRYNNGRSGYYGRPGYYGSGGYGRSRTIYVIERNRPVQRVVYVTPSGSYYRVVDGRRVYVRERYYTSYPSRYYYSDGRPRVGISIRF